MNLLEIFNAKPTVKWSQSDHEHRGVFEYNGSTYTLSVDEYDVNVSEPIVLLDVGFTIQTKDGRDSIDAVGGDSPAAGVIGSVLNGLLPKIKSLKPDAVVLSVGKKSGLVESRKKIYNTVATWAMKHIGFTSSTAWQEGTPGFFKVLSNRGLTKQELEAFENLVKAKE